MQLSLLIAISTLHPLGKRRSSRSAKLLGDADVPLVGSPLGALLGVLLVDADGDADGCALGPLLGDW